MKRRVAPIPKIDSDLTESEIISECQDLFQMMKGITARQNLEWLREHVPEAHPLRYRGELAFWNMKHSGSEREFKKQYHKRGAYPSYSWEKR